MDNANRKVNDISAMAKVILKKVTFLKNKIYYAQESIKNRYPCSIIKYEVINNKYFIYYCVLGMKNNIHRLAIEKILDDPLLLEKFHPKDTIIMGFIAGGEILLNVSYEQQPLAFDKILSALMTQEVSNDV